MRQKGRIGVAVIDENCEFRSRLTAVLSNSAHFRLVFQCGSVEEALTRFRQHPPDVVVVDPPDAHRMKTLVREFPALQAIVLTHREDEETVFDLLRGGATGYILKRDSLASICGAIEDAFNGGCPLSPEIAGKLIRWFQSDDFTARRQVSLTKREKLVLAHAANGSHNKQIADLLGLSEATVRAYLRAAYNKLGVESRSEAIARFQSSS